MVSRLLLLFVSLTTSWVLQLAPAEAVGGPEEGKPCLAVQANGEFATDAKDGGTDLWRCNKEGAVYVWRLQRHIAPGPRDGSSCKPTEEGQIRTGKTIVQCIQTSRGRFIWMHNPKPPKPDWLGYKAPLIKFVGGGSCQWLGTNPIRLAFVPKLEISNGNLVATGRDSVALLRPGKTAVLTPATVEFVYFTDTRATGKVTGTLTAVPFNYKSLNVMRGPGSGAPTAQPDSYRRLDFNFPITYEQALKICPR